MVSVRNITNRFLGTCCIAVLAGLALWFPWASPQALEAQSEKPLVLAKTGAVDALSRFSTWRAKHPNSGLAQE